MKEHIMGCDVFQPLFAQNGIYFSFRIKIFSNLILQIAEKTQVVIHKHQLQ
jgi:hypothetical protein